MIIIQPKPDGSPDILAAQTIKNVIHCHIEQDGTVSAYQDGDTLPPELLPQPPNPVLEQILELEAQVTQRMLRESTLGIVGGKERLTARNTQISELRKKL